VSTPHTKVLGLISGTSHDGIDAAVVDFALLPDGVLHGTVLHVGETPYDPALRKRLRESLPPGEIPFAEVCALDTLIGQAFAEVAADAVVATGPVDLVCSHGQTVFHWVDGQQVLGTLQIGQPAWIAERVATPVVGDVRIGDVVAGGQGAPLVALMDLLLLGAIPGRPAALNLGGIANMTVPHGPAGPIAYDLGPANALIDAAATLATDGRLGYDEDGRLAASGTVHEDLLARLLRDPYYGLPAPKSTGKELFNAAYLDRALAAHEARSGIDDADVVATVTALTAETVAAEVRRHGVDTLVVSGGGCANPVLMGMLAERVPDTAVVSSAQLGAPPGAKEAIAFALIGWYTAHGLAAAVPNCTGAREARLLGSFTPGPRPLRLPEPLAEAPTALRLALGQEVGS
jgi:anhydro-N-acetylmuramic acid kinase